MDNVKVFLNVLNYNTYDKTKLCIDSCLKQKDVRYRILLIDNNSTDDSYKRLQQLYGDKIDYLQTGNNYGYAKGNNLGVEYSLNHSSRYTLILNSDTELVGEFLVKKLVETIEAYENFGIVAPLIYDVTQYGLQLNTNDFLYYKYLRFFGILPRKKVVNKEIELINYAQGSALLVDNENFLSIGGFPEHYFMYCEESTFAKQTLWNKKNICWCKFEGGHVLHHHDRTNEIVPWREFLKGRNLGIEYYENRENHHPYRWGIVYNLFMIWMRVHKKKYLCEGMKEAKIIHEKKLNKEQCYNQAVEIRKNYK